MKYVLFEDGTKIPYDNIAYIEVVHKNKQSLYCNFAFDLCWEGMDEDCYTKYSLKNDKLKQITTTHRRLFKTTSITTYAQTYHRKSGSYKIINCKQGE